MSDPRDVAAQEADLAQAVQTTRALAVELRQLLAMHGEACGCPYCHLREDIEDAVQWLDARTREGRDG